jgi:Fe2+ or Zn2+ uptake regulation protein
MNTAIDINSIHNAIVKDCTSMEIESENNQWYSEFHNENKYISTDVLNDIKNSLLKEDKSLAYKYYLISAIPLLDEFSECKKNLTKISFFKMNNINQSNDYIKIIEKYIHVVEKFFPNEYNSYWKTTNSNQQLSLLKKNKNTHKKSNCQFCNGSSDNFIISDNNIVCQNCGNVHDITNDNLISYKDIERINIGSKYSYDRKMHFKECMKRYQGKQNCTIPSLVFDNIIVQLKKYKLIPDHYSMDDNVVYKNIKRQHILMILKDLGYSKYYEDITYIYHKLTRNSIPDIMECENVLLADFDKLLEVYDNTYKDDRKNFINNQYVLYQLLRRHNYPCEKENFSFLKTNDRKFYHDEVCSILFKKLNWNFRPLF